VLHTGLYDNRYLRYFKSHTDVVTSLSMSPISDHFLSASEDKTVCIWDMNMQVTWPSSVHIIISWLINDEPLQSPAAKLSLPPSCVHPQCVYDTSGVVFGVLCQCPSRGHSMLKLYDARAYESGPFDNIFPSRELIEAAISQAAGSQANMLAHTNTQSLKSKLLNSKWSSFEFSADGGRSILVNTPHECMMLLDGFVATQTPKLLCGRKNESGTKLGAVFSADAKYVITGNEDNDLLVYDKETTELVQTLQGNTQLLNLMFG
jgi:COMPASS component SWD2